VVHGWEHVGPTGMPASISLMLGRVIARGCEEFWAVDEEEARSRIELALGAFERARLQPAGFVAPGWLASPETMKALKTLSLRFVASHGVVHDLARGRRRLVPVVSQRPGGRSQGACARLVERVVGAAAAVGAPIRVAIHPGDTEHDECVRSVQNSIAVLRDRGYRFMTYGDYVDGIGSTSIGVGAASARAAA